MKHRFEIPPLEADDFFVLTDHAGTASERPPHWHLHYELAMIRSPHGLRTVGDSHEEFAGLDLVLTGPRLPHRWQAGEGTNYRITTLHFHGDFADCHTVGRRVFSHVRTLLERSSRGVAFDDAAKAEAHDRLFEILRADHVASAFGFLSLLDFLSSAPGQRILASEGYRPGGMASTDGDRRIRLVADYVDSRYPENVTLADAARLAGLTQSAFCHFFKKQTGESFVEYLNGIRIGHAARMLCRPAGSVADIASACGFRDASNFIREFRKRMETTPSRYRAQALGRTKRI